MLADLLIELSLINRNKQSSKYFELRAALGRCPRILVLIPTASLVTDAESTL